MEEDDLGYERKLAILRAAIKEGDESGIALPAARVDSDLIPDHREGH